MPEKIGLFMDRYWQMSGVLARSLHWIPSQALNWFNPNLMHPPSPRVVCVQLSRHAVIPFGIPEGNVLCKTRASLDLLLICLVIYLAPCSSKTVHMERPSCIFHLYSFRITARPLTKNLYCWDLPKFWIDLLWRSCLLLNKWMKVCEFKDGKLSCHWFR